MTEQTNETEQPKQRVSLSIDQRIDIYEKLKEVCLRVDAEHCIYRDKYSDDRLASEMAFECNAGHVYTIRKAKFGELRKTSDAGTAELVERIIALEERVASLEYSQSDETENNA